MNTLIKTALAGITLAVCSHLVYGAAGDLDTTFNSTGKVTTPIGSDAEGFSVALQSDNKIVGAGYSYNGSNTDFAVVRYNADGSLDTTFGGTGKVTTPIGSSADMGESIALQSDGKIVVAGFSVNGNGSNTDFAVVRYNTDGSLDTTFGGTGKVTTTIGSDAEGFSVALQSDGKIVVAGYSYNGNNEDFAVVRYNANGSLDTTFGGTGKVTTDFIGRQDYAESVALQSDGKIVVAGYSNIGVTIDFAVVRYNANGSLDTTFGGTGKVTTPVGPQGVSHGYSVALQSDGKIVVAGDSDLGSSTAFAVVRYNADGSLDTTFGGTGKVLAYIDPGIRGRSVALSSDGKIVVAGGTYGFAVVRFNADGSLDTTFGGTGQVTTHIGIIYEQGRSVALSSDGKIVVAGYSSSAGSGNFVVMRYIGVSTPSIATNAASSITATGATLNGIVNANASSTTVSFDYGTGISYGTNVTGTPSPVTGSTDTAVTANISGLSPGTTYHFRVNGTNSSGTTDGTDLTFTTLTIIQNWRQFYFGTTSTSGNTADSASYVGDGVSNLLKFAFGMNPTVNSGGTLQYTGTFAGNGTITATGLPLTWLESIANGVDFRALFVRRKDYVAAGLTFTPQFSPDLITWTDSTDTPTVLADDGTNQIVSVPYPLFIGGKKARFFRVQVSTP